MKTLKNTIILAITLSFVGCGVEEKIQVSELKHKPLASYVENININLKGKTTLCSVKGDRNDLPGFNVKSWTNREMFNLSPKFIDIFESPLTSDIDIDDILNRIIAYEASNPISLNTFDLSKFKAWKKYIASIDNVDFEKALNSYDTKMNLKLTDVSCISNIIQQINVQELISELEQIVLYSHHIKQKILSNKTFIKTSLNSKYKFKLSFAKYYIKDYLQLINTTQNPTLTQAATKVIKDLIDINKIISAYRAATQDYLFSQKFELDNAKLNKFLIELIQTNLNNLNPIIIPNTISEKIRLINEIEVEIL